MRIKILSILVILALTLPGCAINTDSQTAVGTDYKSEAEPMKDVQAPAPSPTGLPGGNEIEIADETDEVMDIAENETPYEREAKRDLLALMMAYPNHILDVAAESGLVYVVMESGSRIVYDDMQTKSCDEKLANADLQDTMELAYPLADIKLLFEGDFDPGRIRDYELLMAVYGNSQSEVEANLVSLETDGNLYMFNGVNEVAQKLAVIFAELDDIINEDSDSRRFVYPLASAYYYRAIAGTERLSLHSFGIAIDLRNVETDYWRDATREQGQQRLDEFPRAVVNAFEEHGFIWGGKWAHFDLLHFEYRPELIIKARYNIEPMDGQPWHQGYPQTNETAAFIEIINRAFSES